jgi:hypothetical protein
VRCHLGVYCCLNQLDQQQQQNHQVGVSRCAYTLTGVTQLLPAAKVRDWVFSMWDAESAWLCPIALTIARRTPSTRWGADRRVGQCQDYVGSHHSLSTVLWHSRIGVRSPSCQEAAVCDAYAVFLRLESCTWAASFGSDGLSQWVDVTFALSASPVPLLGCCVLRAALRTSE